MDRLSKAIAAKKNSAMMGDDFQYSLGPPDSGFSLFLAERTKKIHFIRHAEGHHNAATMKTGNNDCLTVDHGGQCPAEHPLWDARLTDVGVAQAKALRAHLATRPSGGKSFTSFDLVVVSPLTRACETALHVFGRARKPGCPVFLDEGVAPPESPEARSKQKVAAPRILVREECRERWGKYVCDGRRAITEIYKEFPDFDFSEVENDEDVFYSGKTSPPPPALPPSLPPPLPPSHTPTLSARCPTTHPIPPTHPDPHPHPLTLHSHPLIRPHPQETSARQTSTAASARSTSCSGSTTGPRSASR